MRIFFTRLQYKVSTKALRLGLEVKMKLHWLWCRRGVCTPKAPLNASLAFPKTTPSSHALRGQMSEVPRLIVMIMSLRLQGAGWGLSAGENVFRGWNWWRERRRGGESGLVQQECHVIFPVIPRPLLWKQCTRSECTIPVALATSQTNKQAWHPTNHPLPTPTLGPHGYLSWLGWVYLEAN